MKFFKTIVLVLLFVQFANGQSTEDDTATIRGIMEMQAKAWSNNDIEGFMVGYLESDSLTYFNSSGIKRGYQAMLDGYKERFPTKAHTGTLNFVLRDISKISQGLYWVMGEYHLTREVGDSNGTFMVIFKRINGEWKIIADSSC